MFLLDKIEFLVEALAGKDVLDNTLFNEAMDVVYEKNERGERLSKEEIRQRLSVATFEVMLKTKVNDLKLRPDMRTDEMVELMNYHGNKSNFFTVNNPELSDSYKDTFYSKENPHLPEWYKNNLKEKYGKEIK